MTTKKKRLSYDAAIELAREMVHSGEVLPSVGTLELMAGTHYTVHFTAYIPIEEEVVETEFPTAVGE